MDNSIPVSIITQIIGEKELELSLTKLELQRLHKENAELKDKIKQYE